MKAGYAATPYVARMNARGLITCAREPTVPCRVCTSLPPPSSAPHMARAAQHTQHHSPVPLPVAGTHRMGLTYTSQRSQGTMLSLLARKPENSAHTSSSRFMTSTVFPGDDSMKLRPMQVAPVEGWGGAGR